MFFKIFDNEEIPKALWFDIFVNMSVFKELKLAGKNLQNFWRDYEKVATQNFIENKFWPSIPKFSDFKCL